MLSDLVIQIVKIWYIAAGYGEQMSGGYSIVVDDLFLSDNAIIFATTLKGPESERKGDKPTYPYIVVKMENIGQRDYI